MENNGLQLAVLLRPVGGAAGDCLPHFLADIMKVIVDWKFLAAHRAAKCYQASADSKLDFVAAGFAVHCWHSWHRAWGKEHRVSGAELNCVLFALCAMLPAGLVTPQYPA